MDKELKARKFIKELRTNHQYTPELTDFQLEQIWLNGYNTGRNKVKDIRPTPGIKAPEMPLIKGG